VSCDLRARIELGTNQNSTIVFPLPMDLLCPFLGNGAGPAPAVAAPGTADRRPSRPLGQ